MCDALSLRDSFRYVRKHEALLNGRKSLTEQNKDTALKTGVLRKQFVLHFILPVILSDFVVTYFIWVNCRVIIFLNYDLMRSVNHYFPLPLLSFCCNYWHYFTLCSAKSYNLRYKSNLAAIYQTVTNRDFFFCKNKILSKISHKAIS